MKVLLIDADSKIPNIALMKISAYHKVIGDNVNINMANISYYPHRKKKVVIDAYEYDKVYVSMIFHNQDYLKIENCDNVEYGGTGYSISKTLPDYIETIDKDYSIYPDNNMSLGFLTRGCIRNCYFCIVREKEGLIRQVNTIDNLLKHDRIMFLDNNILALSNHLEIFQELYDKKIYCNFNSGLDIRLLTDANAELFFKLKYFDDYIFAFDKIEDKDIIEEKTKLITKYNKKYTWSVKFYIYTHPNMSIQNNVCWRIKWCKEKNFFPYLTRDISCFTDVNKHLYTDLAAWCNQPRIFKTKSFEEFMKMRYRKGHERIDRVLALVGDSL